LVPIFCASEKVSCIDRHDAAALCWPLQMFARGSESHMYSALLLQQAYAARVQELDSKVANMPRKTAAMQRRLTQQINQLLSGANLANVIYSEAVPCRCGL
jgi:hypothetical protein